MAKQLKLQIDKDIINDLTKIARNEKLSKSQKKFWKKLTEPYLNLRIH